MRHHKIIRTCEKRDPILKLSFISGDVRVSKSTKLGDLLMSDFKLVINSDTYNVPATKHGNYVLPFSNTFSCVVIMQLLNFS